MSSSENDEDVLVTTDPIPVIFHRIATGNSNTIFFLPYIKIFKIIIVLVLFVFSIANASMYLPEICSYNFYIQSMLVIE